MFESVWAVLKGWLLNISLGYLYHMHDIHNIQNTTEHRTVPLPIPFTGKEGFSTC